MGDIDIQSLTQCTSIKSEKALIGHNLGLWKTLTV